MNKAEKKKISVFKVTFVFSAAPAGGLTFGLPATTSTFGLQATPSAQTSTAPAPAPAFGGFSLNTSSTLLPAKTTATVGFGLTTTTTASIAPLNK